MFKRENLSASHLKDFSLNTRFLAQFCSRMIFASLYLDKEENKYFAFSFLVFPFFSSRRRRIKKTAFLLPLSFPTTIAQGSRRSGAVSAFNPVPPCQLLSPNYLTSTIASGTNECECSAAISRKDEILNEVQDDEILRALCRSQLTLQIRSRRSRPPDYRYEACLYNFRAPG